jgi:hypothetical protein
MTALSPALPVGHADVRAAPTASPRRVGAASLVGTTLEFYDHFIFGKTRDPTLVILASAIGMICQAALWAPLAAFIPEMFESQVRCTGASLGFQLAGVFGGALAPTVCVWLLNRFNDPIYISAYCAVGLLLIALCVCRARTPR